jgi:peptidoglycan/xylan/chitin deacetylase (PgdA/CDA1 family)
MEQEKLLTRNVKRIVIIVVSLAVFVVDRLWHALHSLLSRRTRATAVVLYYHSIPKEKRAAFARQMDMLVRISKPRRADAAMPHTPGAHYVSVTFDDGYQNIIENALPELEQRGIPATIFIVPGALGVTPKWEDSSGGTDAAMNEPILTAEQLRELPSDLVQIGSHTLTHPMLSRLPEQEARAELSMSRTMLEEITGREVTLFSFPYGSFSAKLIAWCRDEGYERVFTTVPRLALSEPSEYVVGRVAVDPDDFPLEFHLKLHGTYRWLSYAAALRTVASRMRIKERLRTLTSYWNARRF